MNGKKPRERSQFSKRATFTVELGGLGDHIRDQLRAQGIKLPLHATASLERTRLAIIQLRATRCISDAIARRAESRLLEIIQGAIQHGY